MKPAPVISEKGGIDWSAGQYLVRVVAPVEDTTGKRLLVHRASGDEQEIDADYNINGTWVLRNNHDDQSAQLFRTNAQNYMCKKFFPDGKGPNRMKVMRGTDRHWDELVDSAVKQIEATKVLSSVSKEDLASFETPQKDQRKAHTQAARAALKRKAQELDDRVRRVKL